MSPRLRHSKLDTQNVELPGTDTSKVRPDTMSHVIMMRAIQNLVPISCSAALLGTSNRVQSDEDENQPALTHAQICRGAVN
jgi:hypothetical protein